jgi:hypothetical protein
MITEDKKEQAMQLMDECSKCINEGNTDSFRSYEEGVKDALDWVYCNGQKPLILEEE